MIRYPFPVNPRRGFLLNKISSPFHENLLLEEEKWNDSKILFLNKSTPKKRLKTRFFEK
jgi:hypothetical protein